ncbi:unnamed protein product [Heligmosomoides polygyrus]|uniref:Uncharacterized protein n=1 Tax=Heligmosomoides polygyrus TaxID=6339 RepID=A0A3P8DLV8_HELPZ|nr:unnamed protein product [Heligmosomoides polygyrus]
MIAAAAELGDTQPQSTLVRAAPRLRDAELRPSSVTNRVGGLLPSFVDSRDCRLAERDIDRLDRALDRMEHRNDASTLKKTKPPPPPRKPCCSKDGLPPSSVVSLPPPMPLSESGPLVFSRAPTITDV